jgi:hypothetical protein
MAVGQHSAFLVKPEAIHGGTSRLSQFIGELPLQKAGGVTAGHPDCGGGTVGMNVHRGEKTNNPIRKYQLYNELAQNFKNLCCSG